MDTESSNCCDDSSEKNCCTTNGNAKLTNAKGGFKHKIGIFILLIAMAFALKSAIKNNNIFSSEECTEQSSCDSNASSCSTSSKCCSKK